MPPTTALHRVLDAASELSESTRKRYRHDLDEWVAFAGEDPKAWTPANAQAFYEYLLHSRKIQVNSANVKIASLRYVSKWWASSLRKPELDFVDIRLNSYNEKPDRRALTQEQITMLLLSIARDTTPIGRRDRTLIVVGLETGMRRISLAGMAFENLDRSEGYPTIRVPVKGRASKMFNVPLSDTAMLVLADWQSWLQRKRGRVFCNLTKGLSKTGELVYEPGTSISTTAINKIIGGRAVDAGIDHVHPHLMRNTYVTDRMSQGLPPHVVAAITGHTLPGLGAMAGYLDMKTIAETARNSTPPWFSELVTRILQ